MHAAFQINDLDTTGGYGEDSKSTVSEISPGCSESNIAARRAKPNNPTLRSCKRKAGELFCPSR
jgi:hypothetical protein